MIATDEMAAKELTYIVQIKIGALTQSIENIPPNQPVAMEEMMSPKGEKFNFPQVLLRERNKFVVDATVRTIA